MQLTDAQKQTVKKWVEEGSSLSDIQKKLASELSLAMTYMDVRLLMLELDYQVKDRKAPPVAPAASKRPESVPGDADDAGMDPAGMGDDDFGDEPAGAAPGGLGSVSVEVSRLTKPGSIVSGSVTFSDGMTANWSLDQMGRLGLMPSKQGYRPSESDIQAFQLELRRVLSTKGF